jgi:hypothetical protein
MNPRGLTVLLLGLSSCAPTVGATSDATSGGGGASTGSGSATGGGGAAGHWTQCSSPEGFAVCNGPHDCPDTPQSGPTTGCHCATAGKELALCLNEALDQPPFGFGATYVCPDGAIRVNVDPDAPTAYFCLSFDIGILFAKNGAADRVRYADWGLWTGAAIPEPTTCPTINNVNICGGHCGGCVAGDFCTGRSPLHPYGVCLPQHGLPSCKRQGLACTKAGTGCFLYGVESGAQAVADDNGYCLPIDQCQAMAASLPGGGTCMPAKN